MGWLFHPVPSARNHDRNAEIDRIFTSSDPSLVTYEILQKSWRGNTCYVACKITNIPTGKTETIGFVILTKSYMEDGTRWWGYKDMDETMGPYHTNAPKSLIDKLTPTENEYALKWREACLHHAKPKPKLTRFRTANPVKFGNFTAQEFEKVDLPRKRGVYKALDHYDALVRLRPHHLEGATPI